MVASLSACHFDLLLSSFKRTIIFLSAYIPGAAMIPACHIPPPSRWRLLFAF